MSGETCAECKRGLVLRPDVEPDSIAVCVDCYEELSRKVGLALEIHGVDCPRTMMRGGRAIRWHVLEPEGHPLVAK